MSTFVRLNLGCGDKILDGYINVDIVDERAGNKPDINCDVRQLTIFEDNQQRLWIGTLNGGLNLFHNNQFSHFGLFDQNWINNYRWWIRLNNFSFVSH